MTRRLEKNVSSVWSSNAFDKRFSRQEFVAGAGATSVALLVAACGGSGTSATTTPSAAGMGGPPEPACDASSGFGCFVPAAPEAGTDIPSATVKFGMRPYADNTFYVITIRKNWFKDVGITITPEPFGIQNNLEALTQMVRGDVELQAMDAGNFYPILKDTKDLKQICFTDRFVAYRILAAPHLGLKTAAEYMDEGSSFEDAVNRALTPVIESGEKLATAPNIITRPFIEAAFQEIGNLPAPPLLLIDDTKNLVLARSGQIEFSAVAGAPQTLELLDDGWTPLVWIGELLENAPPGSELLASLITNVGVSGSADYINSNANTVLRFVSAVFRTIDEIQEDPQLLALQAPFLNAFAGVDLDAESVKRTIDELDPFVPWDQQTDYFRNKESILYYKSAYQVQLDLFAEKGISPPNLKPDDIIWAGQVYDTLIWYQTETDKILEGLAANSLSASQQDMVDRAKEFYEWHDYLDAYRLAKAASEAAA